MQQRMEKPMLGYLGAGPNSSTGRERIMGLSN